LNLVLLVKRDDQELGRTKQINRAAIKCGLTQARMDGTCSIAVRESSMNRCTFVKLN